MKTKSFCLFFHWNIQRVDKFCLSNCDIIVYLNVFLLSVPMLVWEKYKFHLNCTNQYLAKLFVQNQHVNQLLQLCTACTVCFWSEKRLVSHQSYSQGIEEGCLSHTRFADWQRPVKNGGSGNWPTTRCFLNNSRNWLDYRALTKTGISPNIVGPCKSFTDIYSWFDFLYYFKLH